jgi:hypothetical protein
VSTPRRTGHVWGVPIALGVITAVGLIAGLMSDGAGDVVSWLALAIPVGVGLWCSLRR